MLLNTAIEAEFVKMPQEMLRDLCALYESGRLSEAPADLSNYFQLIASAVARSLNFKDDTESNKSFRKASNEKSEKSQRHKHKQECRSPETPRKKTRSRKKR